MMNAQNLEVFYGKDKCTGLVRLGRHNFVWHCLLDSTVSAFVLGNEVKK